MTQTLFDDPRTLLARPDLAELALEGVWPATAYRPTTARRSALLMANIRDDAGVVIDQLVYGETFDVLEVTDGFAWGRARRDGVVGYVIMDALSDGLSEPTHRVAVARAALLGRPGEGAVGEAFLNTLVAVEEWSGGYGRIDGLGWIAETDLAAFDRFESDPATAAERLLGAPWRAGGRTAAGLDAAALVQQALYACGRGCPRHIDRQRTLGHAVETPERGDLAFWNGHAGVMADTGRLIHVDPTHGAVLEPLSAVEGRLGASALRRL